MQEGRPTRNIDWPVLLIVTGIVCLSAAIVVTLWVQSIAAVRAEEFAQRESTAQLEQVPITAAPAASSSAVSVLPKSETTAIAPPPAIAGLTQYIKIVDGCGPHFEGECLRARSGPGTEYPSVAQLRTGQVLKVGETVVTPERIWYEVVFDEWLRYPERLSGKWYVAGDFVEPVYLPGDQFLSDTSSTTDKVIVVDRSEQLLSAYDGDVLFMQESISTGLELTPTPRGTFTVFKKTPSRYMQGPLKYLKVSKYYDLPGVPWNLYFTEQGAVIHGAFWHDNFGQQYSSGCVNMPPDVAQQLYEWASIGTKVVIQD